MEKPSHTHQYANFDPVVAERCKDEAFNHRFIKKTVFKMKIQFKNTF